MVLDVGCGTGRIAIPIAKQGSNVIGLDFSRKILQIARSKAENEGVADRLRFVRGDMKSFSFQERFDLIILPYRTFLFLITVKEQKKTLQNIHEHLTNEGSFVFNVFMPNVRLIANYKPRWRLYRETFNEKTNEGLKIYETRQYNTIDQIIEQKMRAIKYRGIKKSEEKHLTLRFRYFHRFELLHLLEKCNFEVQNVFGDFKGNELKKKSKEMIWIVRRR